MSIFTTEEMNEMAQENTPELTFEDFSHENGIIYWWASEFMAMLGYPNMTSFAKPIQRAMQACLSSNIDCHDNFIKVDRIVNTIPITDYKLTRFGCYMIAMNGDVKKPEVAAAQVYFAKQVEKIDGVIAGANEVERLITREEIKGGNKSLMATAKAAGVQNFGLFQDAGYRGMYNAPIKTITKRKGLEANKNLYEYMGKTELAANLFRIAMTEEKLKKLQINQEFAANTVHKQVGADVRKMVVENTGLNPEDLPIERRLGDVSKELKRTNKQLNKKK